MAELRHEAKAAVWDSFDSPETRRRKEAPSQRHGEKLKEHRERIDKHKMYLMHIAQEADLQKQCEDQSSVPSINAVSKKLERNDRVENVLIQKGKDYLNDIDKKREELRKEEDVNLLFSPRISEMAAGLGKRINQKTQRPWKIHDKLIDWGEKIKADRVKQESSQALAEGARKTDENDPASDSAHSDKGLNRAQQVLGLTTKSSYNPGEHQPVINSRSRVLESGVGHVACIGWGEDLKKHKEHIREAYEEQELAALQEQPTIGARSKKLAQKTRGDAAIEDSLLQRAADSKAKKQERAEQMDMEECPHQPKITSYAAGLAREGPVSERLYAKSFEYRAKKEEQQQQQMREIQEMARRTPRLTNSAELEYVHSPRYTDSGGVPIEIDLQRREQERQSRIQEAAEMREREEALLHYPKINTMSDLIANQLPEDSIERLLKPKKEYVYEEPVDTNLTFHPQLNARSVAINAKKVARGEVVDVGRNEFLYQKDEENKLKLEQARKAAEDKELEECTFQPRINRNSAAMAPSSTHSVVTRTAQWQKQRMARLRQQREEIEMKEKESCTFQPSIGSYKGKAKPRKPRPATSAGSVTERAEGIEQHIARQAKARKQREDVEKIPHATGTKWTNTVTEPKEFTFSHRIKVSALGQPISQQNAVTTASQMSSKSTPRANTSDGGTKLGGQVSAEWARRAAEKRAAEEAHKLAGMSSPRYYAGDALHSDELDKNLTRGMRGEEAYVERMRIARLEKAEREQAADKAAGSGSNWTGKTTKPKEFNFSTNKIRVKAKPSKADKALERAGRALSQPVSPMTR